MIKRTCFNCKEQETTKIDTYKRSWLICNECGSAHSEQKKHYSFSFLPRHYLKKNKNVDFASIYDSMVSDAHIQQSHDDFDSFKTRFSHFIEKFLEKKSSNNILDISGGNGHFLNCFKTSKNNLVLTEVNQKSIDYANNHLGHKAFYYDVNKKNLKELLKTNKIKDKFDLIMVRACSMFVEDLDAFVAELRENLNDGGVIVMNRNVQPTVGTFARTQFDEFSYLFLRQPQEVIITFERNKLKITKVDGDPDIWDFYLNYYDLDLLGYFVSAYYKFKAILKLRKKAFTGEEKFSFRRRDRQMFYIVAEHA